MKAHSSSPLGLPIYSAGNNEPARSTLPRRWTVGATIRRCRDTTSESKAESFNWRAASLAAVPNESNSVLAVRVPADPNRLLFPEHERIEILVRIQTRPRHHQMEHVITINGKCRSHRTGTSDRDRRLEDTGLKITGGSSILPIARSAIRARSRRHRESQGSR
jgi:hypothetical protein